MNIILSCEHAVSTIPAEHAELFAGAGYALESHLGYDIGAQAVVQELEALAEAAFYGGCSRLLIDLNRSLRHPELFSTFSRHLPRQEKERIVADWYTPFRKNVLEAVDSAIARHGEVLHLSLHSFTPVLEGVARTADVGILYDPARHREKEMGRKLAAVLRELQPELKVRMNTPYRGTADGHTTALRRRFSGDQYLGIELEVNQSLLEDEQSRQAVGRLLLAGLTSAGLGKTE